MYIYIYIYVCNYVCMYVCMGSSALVLLPYVCIKNINCDKNNVYNVLIFRNHVQKSQILAFSWQKPQSTVISKKSRPKNSAHFWSIEIFKKTRPGNSARSNFHWKFDFQEFLFDFFQSNRLHFFREKMENINFCRNFAISKPFSKIQKMKFRALT